MKKHKFSLSANKSESKKYTEAQSETCWKCMSGMLHEMHMATIIYSNTQAKINMHYSSGPFE